MTPPMLLPVRATWAPQLGRRNAAFLRQRIDVPAIVAGIGGKGERLILLPPEVPGVGRSAFGPGRHVTLQQTNRTVPGGSIRRTQAGEHPGEELRLVEGDVQGHEVLVDRQLLGTV